MLKTQTDETINSLVAQLKVDADEIAAQAEDAVEQMAQGSRNGAIGALLSSEAQIDRMNNLFRTILALHRTK